jgi:hypothetical protein
VSTSCPSIHAIWIGGRCKRLLIPAKLQYAGRLGADGKRMPFHDYVARPMTGMLFEESDGSIDGLIDTSPGAGGLNHWDKPSEKNLFGRGDGVAKRVGVGDHSSRTLGKSWAIQNCDLNDDLHNYGHAHSSRRTAFLENPCALLETYLRIQQRTRVDTL